MSSDPISVIDARNKRLLPASPGNLATVMVHLSDMGDVFGRDGHVNLASDGHKIESVCIMCSRDVIRYRVLSLDGTWTSWVRRETSVGSRGENQPLIGIGVQVDPAYVRDFRVEAAVRFSDGSVQATFSGSDLYSADAVPMAGLQVSVARLRADRGDAR